MALPHFLGFNRLDVRQIGAKNTVPDSFSSASTAIWRKTTRPPPGVSAPSDDASPSGVADSVIRGTQAVLAAPTADLVEAAMVTDLIGATSTKSLAVGLKMAMAVCTAAKPPHCYPSEQHARTSSGYLVKDVLTNPADVTNSVQDMKMPTPCVR